MQTEMVVDTLPRQWLGEVAAPVGLVEPVLGVGFDLERVRGQLTALNQL